MDLWFHHPVAPIRWGLRLCVRSVYLPPQGWAKKRRGLVRPTPPPPLRWGRGGCVYVCVCVCVCVRVGGGLSKDCQEQTWSERRQLKHLEKGDFFSSKLHCHIEFIRLNIGRRGGIFGKGNFYGCWRTPRVNKPIGGRERGVAGVLAARRRHVLRPHLATRVPPPVEWKGTNLSRGLHVASALLDLHWARQCSVISLIMRSKSSCKTRLL